MSSSRKRFVSSDDLYRLNTLTACELSPSGETVAYAVQRVDQESENKYTNLWVTPTARSAPRQFTYGDQVDGSPVWSPDGSQIAFVSNRADESQPQIYIIPIDGGEARPLTDMQGQFGSFEWSPDGSKLVCQFRKKDAAVIEREADERSKKLGVVSRDITHVFFKADGAGFLPEERWHIWVVDARTGKATQLTDGEYDDAEPTWSPDSQTIAFFSNRADEPDVEPHRADLCLIDAGVEQGRGELTIVPTFEGVKSNPSFSPDGRSIAFYGSEGTRQFWRNTDLWIVPVDGSKANANLTGTLDVAVDIRAIGDSAALPMSQPPIWSADGETLYFHVSRHGRTTFNAISTSGDADSFRALIDEPAAAGQVAFDESQQKMVYQLADAAYPGDIWTRPVDGGRTRRLTRINGNLLRARALSQPQEVWIEGPDGFDLQGWILTPPDFDEDQQYPAILEIHGGPQMMYGNLYMHEFQFLAANGYVVFYCNPRGSQGYGNAFVDALVNDFADPTHRDLMAWTDHIAALPYVDETRLGVTGGSFGGYMTNWIVGQTDRFKAAVTQRSLSNLVSMNGTADFNWIFQYWQDNVEPWADVEKFWRQSPLKYVANVKTPTLVMHSESDLRVDVEQGEQFFVALKRVGVDTEFIRFPDESHGLSRGGRTDRRIARLQHMLRWFDRYLK